MVRSLLVEGWRGINQSYSLVNQYQLLELLKMSNIKLMHRDLPLYAKNWNSSTNSSGFDTEEVKLINSIPEYDSQPLDAILRISFPLRMYGGVSKQVFIFGTSEYEVERNYIYQGQECTQSYPTEAIKIITPSHWSRRGFINFGFKPEDVVVIPLGINPSHFYPLSDDERHAWRQMLDLPADTFVFLNIGATTPNKGIDSLLLAFAEIRHKHPNAMLLLKDQSKLYMSDAAQLIAQVKDKFPNQFNAHTVAGIRVITDNLNLHQLRMLYGSSDAYVSPYRAEGFGLTPLEAAACGTPVIVTEGGATDDYCKPSFALKIASKVYEDGLRQALEPDLDSLIDCMGSVIENRALHLDLRQGAAWVASNFSWQKVTMQLASVLFQKESILNKLARKLILRDDQ